jgi:hypothetical protein
MRTCCLAMMLLAAMTATSRATTPPVDVTFCGQEVPAGVTGILQVDLDCVPDNMIFLDDHATLELNGHEIGHAYVLCNGGHCTVNGPGRIHDGAYGIYTSGPAIISDLDIEDVSEAGIQLLGLLQRSVIRLTNVDIRRADRGIHASRLRLTNVTVTDCTQWGISVVRGRISGSQVVISNDSTGINGERVSLVGLTASGNVSGVQGGRVRLRDSNVTGNSTYDVYTSTRPRLVNTSCDHSFDFVNMVPWGVCALD